MKKIGIIGCGSMGSMMLHRFIQDKAVDPYQVTVYCLDKPALRVLKQQHPGVDIASSNGALARECRLIFICVPPLAVKNVLEEIEPFLKPEAHLVSIAASVTLDHLQCRFNGKISRIVPSITARVEHGVTLVCHNRHVRGEDADELAALFARFCRVKVVDEVEMDVITNLTSTAPGLIAAMLGEFVESGIRFSSLSRPEVEELVVSTFYSTSQLFHRHLLGFPEAVSQVATRGGITEAGAQLIRQKMPELFDDLFARTLEKFSEIRAEVSRQFI